MKSDRNISRRLIEEWMPIAELSEESVRERRSMTALPPTYYLHVWWARRPLVASRAAILGSLFPADADKEKFMHVLGIHGDPVAAKRRMQKAAEKIDEVTGKRENLGANPYGYKRAFTFLPDEGDLVDAGFSNPRSSLAVLDPTAGGGSIPFESVRLGMETFVNDLNPVAWTILKTTVEYPKTFGNALLERFFEIGKKFKSVAEKHFTKIFPPEAPSVIIDGYLWARTVKCPYCGGIVPLSPNWRLDVDGTGIRLVPMRKDSDNRHVRFELVHKASEQSPGTVRGGVGECPFEDCRRAIDGDEIKRQAQTGEMGEQLYAVAYKEQKVVGHTKAGKPKIKNERGYRVFRPEDDVHKKIKAALDAKMPEWLARGIVPDEEILPGNKTEEPRRYGMALWRDLFAPRQLYGHCVGVDVFQELVSEYGGPEKLSDIDRAAFTYLAVALDKFVDWNSRQCTWEVGKDRIAHTFHIHGFPLKWSFAEMPPMVVGGGFEWVIDVTVKALKELIELSGGPTMSSGNSAPTNDSQRTGKSHQQFVAQSKFDFSSDETDSHPSSITVSCGSGDQLSHIPDASVDSVVMDPPYYANVMYAELSDFFYVWLKRTAGLLYPEQFMSYLTDKDAEAVANVARFKEFKQVRGSGGAEKRAKRDYQERMQAIFTECRRVLKPDGIMVLMFTHKATGAWDALAKGLIEAGFVITASWPINTEAEDSLHIKDKNAAKSTIFLVCRPRTDAPDKAATYWEEVEPEVARTVRERVQSFQDNGIRGVDLYLACFGPALEVFSRHWPMQRGRAIQKPEPVKGAQLQLDEEEDFDPYAVRPEDALLAARREVKQWRLARLVEVQRKATLDPVTEFFALAWDCFGSVQFPADEALKLARVVGVPFDASLRNHILTVKGNDVTLLDSLARAQAGTLGKARDTLLDDLHQAAHLTRTQTLEAAKAYLERANRLGDQDFHQALDTLLHVLPAPRLASGPKNSPITQAAADADALDKIRRLCFSKDIPEPKQWAMEFE